jgi:hypothetical protein
LQIHQATCPQLTVALPTCRPAGITGADLRGWWGAPAVARRRRGASRRDPRIATSRTARCATSREVIVAATFGRVHAAFMIQEILTHQGSHSDARDLISIFNQGI